MYDKARCHVGLTRQNIEYVPPRRHPHWARPSDYVAPAQAHKGLGCDAKSALLGSAAPV
jgi:hypothetical protein